VTSVGITIGKSCRLNGLKLTATHSSEIAEGWRTHQQTPGRGRSSARSQDPPRDEQGASQGFGETMWASRSRASHLSSTNILHVFKAGNIGSNSCDDTIQQTISSGCASFAYKLQLVRRQRLSTTACLLKGEKVTSLDFLVG
jgi:hypothetical protein